MLFSLLIGLVLWRRSKKEFLARTHIGLIQGKKRTCAMPCVGCIMPRC